MRTAWDELIAERDALQKALAAADKWRRKQEAMMKTTAKALVRSHKATRKMIQKTNQRIPHKAQPRLRKVEARLARVEAELANLRMSVFILERS